MNGKSKNGKQNQKWKISQILLERRTLRLSSYIFKKKKKKVHFFVMLILSEEFFFNICVLSRCIAYRINFVNIFTLQSIFNFNINIYTLIHTFIYIYISKKHSLT